MARTESPDDIRRMTAEMRRNYDNPDPRPQLRRGNPNAVSAAETKAQLLALREGESSPEQVALKGYAQAIREGKVVEGGLGAAATIAPMVAGMFTAGGKKMSAGSPLWYATHGTPVSVLDKILDTGYMRAPSIAIAPAGAVKPAGSGFSNGYFKPNASVLFRRDTAIPGPSVRSVLSREDGGTPAGARISDSIEGFYLAGGGEKTKMNGLYRMPPHLWTKPDGYVKAAEEQAYDSLFREYTGNTGLARHGIKLDRFGIPVATTYPEKVPQEFIDHHVNGRAFYPYIESKIFDNIPVGRMSGVVLDSSAEAGLLDRVKGKLTEAKIPYEVVDFRDENTASKTIRDMSDEFHQASKGGSNDRSRMANFLATDKVPNTIFGIPVVSRKEDYTDADLAFFRDHPEAGGYYDMGEGTPEDGSEEGAPVQADEAGDAMGLRDLWNRAVKSTGNLDGMARVFAAMSGESSLNQRGATAEQISNGHLARLIVHANETDRYNGNPANTGKRSVSDTTNRTSHVLSKYKWGAGPGANWFDAEKMEPRFDLIDRNPVAAKTARALIMNGARFLNGELSGKDWLPSDAVSYGDGPNGLMPDREEIEPAENKIGPMPKGFKIGRKKGTK